MLRFLIPALLTVAATAQSVVYYSAALDNTQEVPPTQGTGHGWSIARLDTTTGQANVFLYYENLTGTAIAAHLHQAGAGVNGGIIVPMAPSGTNSFTGNGTLTPAQITAFLSNGTYVNVHTAANPNGEIRGQVVPSVSTRYTAIMTGTQETPPNASTATGHAIAFLHEPENRLVYLVSGSGLNNVLGAHFHQGPAGTAGPIVVPLNGFNSFAGVSDRLTATQVASWKVLGFYANIHTAAFPNGEIRGQMVPDAGDHWVAAADSTQETPPTTSPGLAGASLIISETGVISVNGSFSGLTGAGIGAHVHVGAPGVAGPIVFPLTINGSTVSGAYTPTPKDLLTLRAGGWYVNIHTALNPNGEVRGQFVAPKLPTTFGEGCPTSLGIRPQAASTGFPSVGSSFSLVVCGALPQSLLLLAFGTNRDTAAGIPLPIELPTVGIPAPRCFALIEPTSTVAMSADSLGNSSLPVDVPFLPALRGGTFFTQWLVLDPAAPGSVATSSALSFTVR